MADLAEKRGFSLGEIEAVLGELLGIHPTKRATFSARLQQLQRMGLPRGANPGRGKRFRYAFWQVADFALCVDLLDAGVPPNLIKTHFGETGVFSMAGMGAIIEQRPASSRDGRYLLLKLHALNYLRSGSAEIQAEHAADHEMMFADGLGQLLDEKAVTPTIVINLTKRLADLKSAVASVMPDHVGEATFLEG